MRSRICERILRIFMRVFIRTHFILLNVQLERFCGHEIASRRGSRKNRVHMYEESEPFIFISIVLFFRQVKIDRTSPKKKIYSCSYKIRCQGRLFSAGFQDYRGQIAIKQANAFKNTIQRRKHDGTFCVGLFYLVLPRLLNSVMYWLWASCTRVQSFITSGSSQNQNSFNMVMGFLLCEKTKSVKSERLEPYE